MGPLATLFVWLLGGMFVIGLAGASLVLVITLIEDVKMLFEDTPENEHVPEH